MSIRNITIGADPELFIIDTSKDDKVISSVGLIPGEKGAPWVKEGWPEGYGLETDNILGEFNIPPVKTKEDFIKSMNFMKNEIRAFVKAINPNYDILCVASKMVDDDQLQSPEAKLFGCSVDYNVYTESENPKPDGESTNLRSAGCHIHVGYFMPNVEDSLRLIKYMDILLGLPSVLIDPDRKRRSLYGKAGCFRLCPYGFEYRVLSAKMYSTDELMALMWNGIQASIYACNNALPFFDDTNVRKAIDTSNVKLAKTLLNKCLGFTDTTDIYIKSVLSLLK